MLSMTLDDLELLYEFEFSQNFDRVISQIWEATTSKRKTHIVSDKFVAQ